MTEISRSQTVVCLVSRQARQTQRRSGELRFSQLVPNVCINAVQFADMSLIQAVDVHYSNNIGYTAGITFKNWSDKEPENIYYSQYKNVEDYDPGNFYKRELPCIVQLINENLLKPSFIIVDGYVQLPGNKPGLGKHLFEALGGGCAIVGVAKKMFIGTDPSAEIYRGNSKKPLYISSEGIALEEAKELVSKMFGANRIPELLKQVDHLARNSSKK